VGHRLRERAADEFRRLKRRVRVERLVDPQVVERIVFFGIIFFTMLIYICGEQIHLKIVQLLAELVHHMGV
jgi:hypothetical protein